METLESSTAGTGRFWQAAMDFWQVPADCQEILAILLMGTSELALREKAAWALGRMKADSRKAKLALQVAARSPEKRLSRMGSEALKQIEKK